MIGIYKITSPTGKVYIGQSVNIEKRLKSYRALWGSKKQLLLYRSLCKHGVDSHVFEVVCECDKSQLNKLELLYIDEFKCCDVATGLNLRSGGDSSKHSEATKLKMSIAQKGKLVSVATRAKLSKAKKGTVRPQIEKDKISKTMKGMIKSEDHLKNIKTALGVSSKFKNALLNRQEDRKRKVINTITGEVFVSAKEAALMNGYSKSNFTSMMNGIRPNKTTFKYL